MNRVSDAPSQQPIAMQDTICTNDQQLHVHEFKKAKSILQKIERLEKKIQSFDEDQRLFQEWEHAHFSDKHAQITALQERCYVLCHYHNRILATSRLLKVSMSKAYRIFKDEEEAFETGSDLTRAMLKQAWAERDQFAQAELIEASEAAMEKQNRKRSSRRIKDQATSFLQSSPSAMVHPPWEKLDEEMKLTYRKLVRKLHPDSITLSSRTLAKADWMSQYWHRMQDAYQAKDHAVLGKLYAMTVIHQQDFSAMTLSEIQECVKWLQQEVEVLQAKAQVFKSSRAWGFSRRKSYHSLFHQISKELSQQMAPLSKQVQFLAFYYEVLEAGRQPLEALQKKWAATQIRHPKRRRPVHANQTSFSEFLHEIPASS